MSVWTSPSQVIDYLRWYAFDMVYLIKWPVSANEVGADID